MKIRKMKITDYDKVYALWCKTPGIGLNDIDDSGTCIIKSHTLDHNLVKGDGKKWEVNIQRNFVATH